MTETVCVCLCGCVVLVFPFFFLCVWCHYVLCLSVCVCVCRFPVWPVCGNLSAIHSNININTPMDSLETHRDEEMEAYSGFLYFICAIRVESDQSDIAVSSMSAFLISRPIACQWARLRIRRSSS